VKTNEAIVEILAAYDVTGTHRDTAVLAGCSHRTVARYVRAREAGELRTTPVQRDQLIDAFREKSIGAGGSRAAWSVGASGQFTALAAKDAGDRCRPASRDARGAPLQPDAGAIRQSLWTGR
jgi:hypothetical protein